MSQSKITVDWNYLVDSHNTEVPDINYYISSFLSQIPNKNDNASICYNLYVNPNTHVFNSQKIHETSFETYVNKHLNKKVYFSVTAYFTTNEEEEIFVAYNPKEESIEFIPINVFIILMIIFLLVFILYPIIFIIFVIISSKKKREGKDWKLVQNDSYSSSALYN